MSNARYFKPRACSICCKCKGNERDTKQMSTPCRDSSSARVKHRMKWPVPMVSLASVLKTTLIPTMAIIWDEMQMPIVRPCPNLQGCLCRRHASGVSHSLWRCCEFEGCLATLVFYPNKTGLCRNRQSLNLGCVSIRIQGSREASVHWHCV